MKNIPAAGIDANNWNFSDIANKLSAMQSIDTGERLLQDHKNDATEVLGHPGHGGPDGKGVEDLDDLAGKIKSDPQMRKAVQTFAAAQAGSKTGDIEDVLDAMRSRDPNAASIIMQHLGLSQNDLNDMRNKRIEAHTEATTKEPQAKPLTPEEKADKLADVQLKLSAVARNNADTKKIHADIDKALADKTTADSIVDSMGTGHTSAANLAYMLRSKEGQELVAKVTAKYPDFDSSKAGSYPKEYDDYTSQKRGNAGFAINSGGTAFQHLQEMQELNTNESHIFGTPAYTRYKNKMDTVVSELGQFYGNTTIPGLQDFKDTLSSTLPGNREAAIRTQAKSMGDKMNSFEHGWINAAPSAHYQAPLPGLSRDALVARAKLDPTFKSRPPEGSIGQESFGGQPYWVNAAHKKLQEVIQ
jgi:hypothetical protein